MGHSAGILIGSSRDHPGITTGYSLGIHGIPFGPRTNLTLINNHRNLVSLTAIFWSPETNLGAMSNHH